MKRALLVLVVAAILFGGLQFLASADNPKIGNKMICPITGKEFVCGPQNDSTEYKGKTYYFCCPMCKPDFEKNPEKYIGAETEKGEGSHEEHQHMH